jgi:hypothetical protein
LNSTYNLLSNLSTKVRGQFFTFLIVQILSLTTSKHRPALALDFGDVFRSGNDMKVDVRNYLRGPDT